MNFMVARVGQEVIIDSLEKAARSSWVNRRAWWLATEICTTLAVVDPIVMVVLDRWNELIGVLVMVDISVDAVE